MKNLLPLFAAALVPMLALGAGTQAEYDAKIETLKQEVPAERAKGDEAFMVWLLKNGRELLKDFPDHSDGYGMLFAVAQRSAPDKALDLLKEIDTDQAPAEVKQEIAGFRARLEAIGKPVDIKFKSTDGREIDLTNMKGQVVLIDFWATWCGPCVQEIPNVVAAYEKLHAQGFEIVGISFDSDKEKLDTFVKEKNMSWPQYFDGKQWKNDFGQKFGISSIPTMWLVDKKGNLVDMEGRQDLTAKVEKLLAQ